MKTKEMKIQAPEGYEIDKENSTFEKIVFKKVENELPEKWEDLGKISGYYISNGSYIKDCSIINNFSSEDKNVFPTKEEAEACLALAQLCQLRDRYNDGWKPDWRTGSEIKYCIIVDENKIVESQYITLNQILSFKTKELRDKFLENFRDLIETAKPLL